MKLADSSDKILCFVGRCQYFGKRARQKQERMGNCQIRTAPRHTPQGTHHMEEITGTLFYQCRNRFLLPTGLSGWKWFVSWVVKGPTFLLPPIIVVQWRQVSESRLHEKAFTGPKNLGELGSTRRSSTRSRGTVFIFFLFIVIKCSSNSFTHAQVS